MFIEIFELILVRRQQFRVKSVQELKIKQYFSLALNSIEKCGILFSNELLLFKPSWAKAAYGEQKSWRTKELENNGICLGLN